MIPGSVRIVVCLEPTDMRQGFDRLAQRARERLGIDPTDGQLLVVYGNRLATRLKLLWFERNGCCLLYKRLHRAKFEVPLGPAGGTSIQIDSLALAKLLAGVPRPARGRRKKTSQ
jgi:transposase